MSKLRSQAPNEIHTDIGPIERMPIGAISLPPRTLRTHSDRNKKQYARCIEALGLISPIIVDASGVIVVGFLWYLGALHLGLKDLPVIRVTHLTPEKLEIYRIAEQRLSELAPWDERALADAFRELSELDLGFSLEVTGFSQGEIDFRIEGFAANQAESADDTADTVPAVGATAVSRHGDQWQLERHRILCGSALQSDTFAALMVRRRAAAVITDPPYNVPIQGHVSGKGRVHHREFAMATGELSSDEFSKFLTSFLAAAIKHVAPGTLLYVFMDWRHCAEIQIAATELGLELKNICVWVKSNAGMGSFYRSQHEFVFIFKHGKAPHRNNVELGRHGRFRTNVWQYPGFNGFERRGEEGNLLALHPTIKPVQLVADALLDCTDRNDIVLDPFLGSGSTLIAAERVGRRLYGIELDPLYVDVAIRRWQRHTGNQAIHVQTGRHFNEIAAEREGI